MTNKLVPSKEPKREPHTALVAAARFPGLDALDKLRDTKPRAIFEGADDKYIRETIEFDRRTLAKFPTVVEINRLISCIRSASPLADKAFIGHQLSHLIACFPHSNIPDPASYFRSLIHDVFERQYPEMLIVDACVTARRTFDYPPSIAKFLELCDQRSKYWRTTTWIAERVIESRERLESAIAYWEQYLAKRGMGSKS